MKKLILMLTMIAAITNNALASELDGKERNNSVTKIEKTQSTLEITSTEPLLVDDLTNILHEELPVASQDNICAYDYVYVCGFYGCSYVYRYVCF